MTTQIAARLSITRRYLRSVNIARDLDDPESLDGYIMTPSARDATIRITHGLAADSRQRAFRLVGAYGSGKSAFGLFLARLLRERGQGPATQLFAASSSQPHPVSNWNSIIIVGRRVSFTAELLRTVASPPPALDISDTLIDKAHLLLRTTKPQDPEDVAALISDVANDLRKRTGAGLLIIIDEMGRFLEYAAVNTRAEDPSIFQSLAERSGAQAGVNLAVLGILHHGFVDYVAGMGSWIETEWARLSSRYEEIRFDSSTEQSLFMLARALNHQPAPGKDIRQTAEQVFRQAIDRGVYTAKPEDVVAIAPYLYPLHPAVIATIASATRRFGQNERSLFSFLHSLEPDGFQRFIRSTKHGPKNWFRTQNVFDHLAATIAETPANARQRRWSLALDACIVAAHLSPAHQDILKTVALFSVLEPLPGLIANADTIAWCLQRPVTQVSSLLRDLCTRRLTYKRSHTEDYSLWSNASVDLSHWLDKAAANVHPPRHLHDVAAFPRVGRSVVAHRHYHTTGTLRSFDVSVWTGEQPITSPTDGRILVVPLNMDQDYDKALRDLGKSIAHPLTLVCLRRIPPAALKWAHEFALWNWVRDNCKELRIDELARTEVSERIATAEAALFRFTALLASPTNSHPDSWWAGGHPIDIPLDALSSVVSNICDDVYNKTPVLRNEVLNRENLTSAGATARMRLLEAMLSNPAEDRLGIKGTPPELAMYLSLFRSSGIHRADAVGMFAFHAPTHSRWQPAWSHITNRLAEEEAIPFADLMRELGDPPFGIRAGPSLLLIAAYMLAAPHKIGIFERGTFVPELTIAHFMRLAKTPRNFALRSFREPANHAGLLPTLANGLPTIGPCDPTVPSITAAMYHWFNRLTPYVLQTDELSPTATAVRDLLRKQTDPGDLFFRHLAEACLPPDSPTDRPHLDPETFTTTLDAALQEMEQAIGHLRRRAIDSVLSAFSATDLASLRTSLHRDLAPYNQFLRDHRLSVFVERATRRDVSDDLWLDGIAGHVFRRRPADWTDGMIDDFHLEVRTIASNLAKWLSLVQAAHGSRASLRSVHVVGIDGRDRMVVLTKRPHDQSLGQRIEAVRALLGDDPDGLEILGRLLEEYIDLYAHPPDTETN